MEQESSEGFKNQVSEAEVSIPRSKEIFHYSFIEHLLSTFGMSEAIKP